MAELLRQTEELEKSVPTSRPPTAFDALKSEARSIATDIPYKPTQGPRAMNWEKLGKMVVDMKSGDFKWQEMIDKGSFIRIGPNGEIVEGHHRILAASLARAGIPKEAIMCVDDTIRMPMDWNYVLR